MAKQYPKVLIISHNVISRTGNMGKTLYTYFENWPKEQLCQLYFHSEVPTTQLCDQYFRVTDFDQLHALCRFKKAGTALTAEDIDEQRITSRTDEGTQAEIYRKGQQRKPWMYLARNALWRLNIWKSRRLDAWIRACRPDVIFFAAGDYTFAFRVALQISKKYQLPLVPYICDDYYFYRKDSGTPLADWNTYCYRKVLEKTLRLAADGLYVTPALQQKYADTFHHSGETLYMKAEMQKSPAPENEPVRIAYLGSLDLGRDRALCAVGQTIRQMVSDGTVGIDVYSAESRTHILEQLTPENGIRFRGKASYAEVQRVIAESDILLLPESCDPALLERLRYSLSTKVAEYLGSNRCILAYGPAEAGSIRYLLENHAGYVATDPVELRQCLEKLLFSPEARRVCAARQIELALRNHTGERNHAVLLRVLQTAAEQKGV